jgi:hypothetical protein
MAIPSFLAGTLNIDYTYRLHAGITDVQDIIDDLYDDLVTTLGWTCTVGGKTQTPTTYKSPVGDYGATHYFTVQFTRAAATQLNIVAKDGYGLQINNETSQNLNVAGGGSDVSTYCGKNRPYVCINAQQAVPQTWWCCEVDPYPEITNPPVWLCAGGPYTNANVHSSYDYSNEAHWMNKVYGSLAYNITPSYAWYCVGYPFTTPSSLTTQSGALLFIPITFQNYDLVFGKLPNVLWVDSLQAFNAELTVPIDTGVTGVFRVTGPPLQDIRKMCWRKS